MISIDGETSLKSLLFLFESVEQLIGQHGAKAIMRSAGQRAAVNLIEMLPLTVSESEAIRRTGAVLAELGFIKEIREPEPGTLQVFGNHIIEALEGLNLHDTKSGSYYVIGLFEGFFNKMSGSPHKIISVEPGEGYETWKLG